MDCNFWELASNCSDLTNVSTMFIELAIGGSVAAIFFIIQHKNSKLINMMLKEQFNYVVKNSINKLLWMNNGIKNMNTLLEDGKIDEVRKIKKLNSEVLEEIKSRINPHNDIAPQLFHAVEELLKINKSNRLSDTENSKMKLIEALEKMTSIIEKQSEIFNVKRFGRPPYPEYVVTLTEKTHFQLAIPRIQNFVTVGTVLATLIAAISTISSSFELTIWELFSFDILDEFSMINIIMIIISVGLTLGVTRSILRLIRN